MTTMYSTGKTRRLVAWKRTSLVVCTIDELVELGKRRRAIAEPLKGLLIDYLLRVGEPK